MQQWLRQILQVNLEDADLETRDTVTVPLSMGPTNFDSQHNQTGSLVVTNSRYVHFFDELPTA